MKLSGLESASTPPETLKVEADERKLFNAIKVSLVRKEERSAILWFSTAVLIGIVYLMFYLFAPSWIAPIGPLGLFMVIGVAIWIGIMHLNESRSIQHWW